MLVTLIARAGTACLSGCVHLYNLAVPFSIDRKLQQQGVMTDIFLNTRPLFSVAWRVVERQHTGIEMCTFTPIFCVGLEIFSNFCFRCFAFSLTLVFIYCICRFCRIRICYTAALWPWGSLGSEQKVAPGIFVRGIEAWLARKDDILTAICEPIIEIMRYSSQSLIDHHGLLQR
jgi:hypothetical protein